MTHFISDDDIDRIGLGVRDRTLPKREWTHAAHFAAAFWILRRSNLNAMRDMPALIRAYNEATGVPNTDTGGYHETITFASLRAAEDWIVTHAREPLHASLNGLLESPYGRSDWPLAYWSKERLFSVDARRRWVEPDRKPLPF